MFIVHLCFNPLRLAAKYINSPAIPSVCFSLPISSSLIPQHTTLHDLCLIAGDWTEHKPNPSTPCPTRYVATGKTGELAFHPRRVLAQHPPTRPPINSLTPDIVGLAIIVDSYIRQRTTMGGSSVRICLQFHLHYSDYGSSPQV